MLKDIVIETAENQLGNAGSQLWRHLVNTTGAVPANQPISDGEATDRCKSLRRKMADCPS